MLSLSVASRFLRRSRGQSLLIISGIAVGIAVQIFVGSLITSLQADLIDSTVGSSAHVTVLPPPGKDTVDGALAGDIGADPRVTTAIPVRKLSAIYGSGDVSVPLSITGGEASDLDTIYDLSSQLAAGEYRLDSSEVLVGQGFAADFDVAPGDTLTLLLPGGDTGEYAVTGVFDLGAAAANDRLAFLDGGSAAEALGHDEGAYSAIEVQVDDVFFSSDVAEDIANTHNVTVTDWQAENEELLSGLSAQSGSSLMIQVFVLVAVALGIASTLAVSAVQKVRQIGILKAMGMSDRAAARIFLWQAGLLGACGTVLGIALGFVLIWGFSFAPVTFTVRPEAGFVAVTAAVGISVALLSSVLPARSTSRVDPIDVIQRG